MAEPHDGGRDDSAMLSLIVEFRQLWNAQEALRAAPDAPAPAPARRIRLEGMILLLCAAAVSAYLLGELLVRSSGMLRQLPWAPRGQTVTAPAAGSTQPPLSPPQANQQPGTSNPSPPVRTSPPVAPPAGTAPAAPATPSPATAPAGGTASAAGYHVQVGAFNVREYAQDLVDQLRSRNYSATVVDVSTGPPHRVWITGVFDRPSAERLLDQLRQDGFEAILLRQ